MAAMSRRAILLAMVALGAWCAFAPGAWARPAHYPTKVTIHELQPAGSNYAGRVKSQRHRCEANRPVEFWKRQPGPDELIHAFNADPDGHWNFGFVGDHYYLIAKRIVIGSGARRFVCDEGRSATT